MNKDLKKSRREFIVQSAMLSGAMLGGFNVLKGAAPEPLKLGIIGTGSRGQGLAHTINSIENVEVVACSDVIPFRLDEVLKIPNNVVAGSDDYRRMLDDKNVDAVIIATPFGMHGQMVLDALDAGKHIYCEKTMVRGIDDIQSVLNKATQNPKLIFQTGHQYHSSALYKKTREIIKSGYLGEITAFHCQWNRNGDWRRPVPDPKWERMINWRMYKEYSGGLIAELMTHQIDFINWVTGDHPAKFVAFGGIDYWKDGRETHDNVHLQMEYSSGIDATFSCTTTNGFEDYQIKILGKNGTIIMDYEHAKIYSEKRAPVEIGMVDGVSGATATAWKKGEGVPINADGKDSTKQALVEFAESIRAGIQPESDVKVGAKAAKCIELARQSLWSGEIKYWNDAKQLKY